MFDELLALNARAAAEADYDAAYHLLMAALHRVEHEAGDPTRLGELTAIAMKQGAEVDALPSHHLARRQAAARGQTALFESFLAHVEAVRLRMEGERQRRKHHG